MGGGGTQLIKKSGMWRKWAEWAGLEVRVGVFWVFGVCGSWCQSGYKDSAICQEETGPQSMGSLRAGNWKK